MHNLKDKINEQCDQLRQGAEKIFNKGYREGFKAGVRQGRREVEAEILMRT